MPVGSVYIDIGPSNCQHPWLQHDPQAQARSGVSRNCHILNFPDVQNRIRLWMILFISMARYNQESISDQWMAILLFGLLFLILIPMMGKSFEVHCVLTQIITVFHGLVVIVICFGHYMALGQQGAGYILTLRSLVTAFVCVAHIIVISLGRNRVCS